MDKQYYKNLLWQLLFIITASILWLSLPISSITSAYGDQSVADSKDVISIKWLDKNCLQVIVRGHPGPELTNQIQRRGTAREAAILFAQRSALVFFINERFDAEFIANRLDVALEISKKFSWFVTRGDVESVKYDADDLCTLEYRLTAPDLKKQVLGS